ncbi:MAG: ATP-binding protein [Clostridia bacterium]|nr:ATP-binding protein [Clostridia bacterium]
MSKSISFRFAVIFGLIFIIAVTLLDTSLIMLYYRHQFKKTEEFYSYIAGYVSKTAAVNWKLTNFFNLSEEGKTGSPGGRILVLNLESKVIADSLKQFEGQIVQNPETREALSKMQVSVGYYNYHGERIAMLAYPMLRKNVPFGIVLISYDVGDLWKDVLGFAYQVVGISLVVVLAVFAASYYFGGRIIKPVKCLTEASKKILEGKTGTTVEILSKDEIGTLAKTFNRMSEELHRIEVGRKRFASNISHELKTPLASIKALIEPFIGEKNVDAEVLNEYLKDVDSEIDRLTGLVKSLVTATRLEEIKPLIEKLNLKEEIITVLRLLSPLFAEKEMKVDHTSSGEIWVYADKTMLREVMINLLDNAVKYGKQGGAIHISMQQSGSAIVFSIRDNGMGISEQDLPNIFDNFYMADEARKSGMGSGIGLYIVKRIADISGWEIRVQSTLGKGSEFEVIIKNSANL